jgi:NDP-sugar pyrophosphorylase family protein
MPAFADVPVALLAGGLATRLRPITHKVPKAMIEVAGRPFIDHQLTLLRCNGIRHVVLCLGYLGELVAEHVGDGSRLGLDVRHSFDGDKLLGTGGALRRALPQLGDVSWVLYGDSYLDIDYRAVFDAFASRPVLGLMTVLHNGNRWDSSNVVFQDGRLLCYDKRHKRPDMEYIDYGASLFRREALERIPTDTACDLADLMHAMVASGEMAGFEVQQRFYEIGSHAGLEETAEYLSRRAGSVSSRRSVPGTEDSPPGAYAPGSPRLAPGSPGGNR